MPLHPQVEWQATLTTLDGTQTLEASWLLKRDIRIASDVDLVLLIGNLDKSDLAKDQVGGGIALEKGGGRILSEREERHPFCCLFTVVLLPDPNIFFYVFSHLVQMLLRLIQEELKRF